MPGWPSRIKAALVEVLLRWLSDRPARPAPDPAARVASWAIYGAAVQWTEQAGRVPWKRFLQQVQPMILASLHVTEPSRPG